MPSAFMTGFGFGFVVAAQVGPIWLLCARSVLRGGFAVGVAIGAGAALVDLLYAALGAAGAAQALLIPPLRMALGLLGAAVLTYLGAKSLWSAFRVRAGLEAAEEVSSPRAAFRTALVATASNPLTIASWAAIFTAASTAKVAGSPIGLTVGVGLGSFSWFFVLSTVASLIRRRIPESGLRIVDGLSGLGLVGFGLILGRRSLENR